ncbi:MAG: hypothetical protein K6T87_10285 [Roseiflexus sp.]|uniref:hypothetical protein n=1 Tax=Roseiflexus sp. TaxID=2562120 RepID=UPI0025D332B6|nr:hypothetical protein [Roseiflexus sp.]MCL6540949.1 hypothetical protein [Roseiflexus sp.]
MFSESTIESAALVWLESAGWQVAHTLTARQCYYSETALTGRLRDALLLRLIPGEL